MAAKSREPERTGVYRKMAYAFLGYAILRAVGIPDLLSRTSYYDPDEAYEYVQGNPYARKPYPSQLIIAYLVPKRIFRFVITLMDFLTAFLLGSPWYLVLSSLTVADAASFFNLVFVAGMQRGLGPWTARMLRILHFLLMLESTAAEKGPGVNTYWYVNMQMDPQYARMHFIIFSSTHIVLLLLSHGPGSPVVASSSLLFSSLLFKDHGYKGYLLLWVLLNQNCREAGNAGMKAYGAWFRISAALFCIEHIIWAMLVLANTGNMNFLCWVCLFQVGASAACTLSAEKEKRSRGVVV